VGADGQSSPQAAQPELRGKAGGHSGALSSHRVALARRARDYLEANCDRPFSLRELSGTVGCSERVLQYVFRDIYGMGPQAWFQLMRLDEANRELRARELGQVRVTDVALRWGFTHLGRFSTEYRRRFGEPPSQTLRRRLSGASS
jgi:AraC-like DNA-binding protein